MINRELRRKKRLNLSEFLSIEKEIDKLPHEEQIKWISKYDPFWKLPEEEKKETINVQSDRNKSRNEKSKEI